MKSAVSGKFILRLDPPLHEDLKRHALSEHVSLNSFCRKLLSEGLYQDRLGQTASDKKSPLISALRKKFGDRFLGLVLFGSQARGETTSSSDVDFLIALDSTIPIQRSLYTWWDEKLNFDRRWSPHFVNLPTVQGPVGGLWMEVALDGIVLFEKNRVVSDTLRRLRLEASSGRARRVVRQGHPFWVWENHEE